MKNTLNHSGILEAKMKKILIYLFLAGGIVLLSCSGNNNQQIFTGVVEGTAVQVPALTSGQILELFTDTGREIVSGDRIAQIDTTELSYQLQQVKGGLQEIRAQEQLAKTNLSRAQSDLNYITEKYRRFQELLKKQSVPQQSVDDLRNQYNNIESAYQSAKQQFATISAKKEQLEAQFKSITKKISDANIISPISGIVSTKYYEKGEAVPPLNPVIEVIDIDEVWVKIFLSETRLPDILVGQDVKIMPDGTDKTLTGKISWISPKAEFTPKTILTEETRTALVYAVKVTIQNKEHILKHGMPVEVQVVYDTNASENPNN
jgi:HlyD family secretion protein